VNGRPDRKLALLGQLIELLLGFLLLPLIVTTMDNPPHWFGGRILVWMGLGLLLVLQPVEVRSRMRQRMRIARNLPGGWIGPTVLYVLTLLGLVVVLQILGLWEPSAAIHAGGIAGVLLMGLLGTLFVVLPLEILFRVYVPMRFCTQVSHPTIWILLLSSFLFAWFHIPSLDPVLMFFALVLGGVLALMERAGWPFWGTLFVHGAVFWIWTVAPRLFTEVLPWG
jgi:membrane protease YdiL (CAAX protease family)